MFVKAEHFRTVLLGLVVFSTTPGCLQMSNEEAHTASDSSDSSGSSSSGSSGTSTTSDCDNSTVTGKLCLLSGTLNKQAFADTTLSTAELNMPIAVLYYSDTLYISDAGTHRIYSFDLSTNVLSVLAGSGSAGTSDGTGTAASFTGPSGLATDGTNLYVSTESCIRKIVISTGVVTTISGSCSTKGYVNGITGTARFDGPRGLELSADFATLYVADMNNCIIRTVDTSNGTAAKLTGTEVTSASRNGTTSCSAADGSGASGKFGHPAGITRINNMLYVTDYKTSGIRTIDIDSGSANYLDVATLAGSGTTAIVDSADSATESFQKPAGIANDGTDLYVADSLNHVIRKVTAAGVVTTLSGLKVLLTGVYYAAQFGLVDGSASSARYFNPTGITYDGSTYLYVVDMQTASIRKVTAADGTVSTVYDGD